MSRYERKYTLSLEINSKVKKMAVLSFILLGLLTTFDSIDFRLSNVISPLGIKTVYPEFTDYYYQKDFTKVIVTLIVLIFSPTFIKFCFLIQGTLLKFYDQRYTFNRIYTRKFTQKDYVQI